MSLDADLARFASLTGQKIDTVVKRSTLDLCNSIIMATPVDTGIARGGWLPSIDAPASGQGEKDRGGGKTLARVNAMVDQAPGNVFFLTNNVPYIRPLEYGHSAQAPQGMVRLAVQQFPEAIRRAIERGL